MIPIAVCFVSIATIIIIFITGIHIHNLFAFTCQDWFHKIRKKIIKNNDDNNSISWNISQQNYDENTGKFRLFNICCMSTKHDTDFYPDLFLFQMINILLLSLLLVIKTVIDDLKSMNDVCVIRGNKSILDGVIIYLFMILFVLDGYFHFHRYCNTVITINEVILPTQKRILKKFLIYGIIFIVGFIIGVELRLKYFYLLTILHLIFNLYCSYYFGKMVIDYYNQMGMDIRILILIYNIIICTVFIDDDVSFLSFDDVINGARLMQLFSIIANILCSICLFGFTFCNNVYILLFMPFIMSIASFFNSLNFGNNRIFYYHNIYKLRYIIIKNIRKSRKKVILVVNTNNNITPNCDDSNNSLNIKVNIDGNNNSTKHVTFKNATPRPHTPTNIRKESRKSVSKSWSKYNSSQSKAFKLMGINPNQMTSKSKSVSIHDTLNDIREISRTRSRTVSANNMKTPEMIPTQKPSMKHYKNISTPLPIKSRLFNISRNNKFTKSLDMANENKFINYKEYMSDQNNIEESSTPIPINIDEHNIDDIKQDINELVCKCIIVTLLCLYILMLYRIFLLKYLFQMKILMN